MKSKLFLAVVIIAALAMTVPASAATIDMGPGVNNGSFETSNAGGDWKVGPLTGWGIGSPGGNLMYIMGPAAGLAPSDGIQSLNPYWDSSSGPLASAGFAATESASSDPSRTGLIGPQRVSGIKPVASSSWLPTPSAGAGWVRESLAICRASYRTTGASGSWPTAALLVFKG